VDEQANASHDAPESGGRGALRWVLAAAVLAMGGALILLGEGGTAPLRRGDAAPDFTRPRLTDAEPASLSTYRGQVVLLNFWATWCKPCEDEMPAMQDLWDRLHDRGFELLAVSVDENEADVAPFVERLDLRFPVLLDPGGDVSRTYQTMGYPESILIDRDGRIVERYVGPKPWNQPDYVDRVERLLGGS